MVTEVGISYSTLQAQLESEKSSLYKIDEDIKKIVQTSGRFQNDRFNNSSGDYNRSKYREGGRNLYNDNSNYYKNDDSKKTKTVFSRLSARVHDSDGEDDGPGSKRTRMPSAVCRELPTRAAVLRAQGDDEQARTRNRRIFGSLLGTLQKFKQEEIVLQTKEEKKAQVERKIEEQARLEKEREHRERKTLFAERDHKKATIKSLEAKIARVEEFEMWQSSQKPLTSFIQTKAKPQIYWIPKKMCEKATEKLTACRTTREEYVARKCTLLQLELQRIEQRCFRFKGPTMKENDPETNHDEGKDSEWNKHNESETSEQEVRNEDGGRKRDKFAMDIDEKEKDDSDGDDRHDEGKKDEVEGNERKNDNETNMDTSAEDNITAKETQEQNEEPLVSVDTSAINDNQGDNQTSTEMGNSEHS